MPFDVYRTWVSNPRQRMRRGRPTRRPPDPSRTLQPRPAYSTGSRGGPFSERPVADAGRVPDIGTRRWMAAGMKIPSHPACRAEAQCRDINMLFSQKHPLTMPKCRAVGTNPRTASSPHASDPRPQLATGATEAAKGDGTLTERRRRGRRWRRYRRSQP